MTGEQLLKELKKLTSEQLKLECVHIHTEYGSPEDSIGYQCVQEIDTVVITKLYEGEYNQKVKGEAIRLGW